MWTNMNLTSISSSNMTSAAQNFQLPAEMYDVITKHVNRPTGI